MRTRTSSTSTSTARRLWRSSSRSSMPRFAFSPRVAMYIPPIHCLSSSYTTQNLVLAFAVDSSSPKKVTGGAPWPTGPALTRQIYDIPMEIAENVLLAALRDILNPRARSGIRPGRVLAHYLFQGCRCLISTKAKRSAPQFEDFVIVESFQTGSQLV